MTAFEEFGVLPEISKAVDEMDWTLPTDIQAEGIPMILGGGDVLMAAETGSGKTGAFCLPIIQIVHETLRDLKDGKSGKVKPAKAAVGKAWKMNVFDRGDAMAIDTDHGLLCQSRDQGGWHGTRSNKGVSGGGRFYYEAEVTDEGLCRVGWSTSAATLDLGTDKEGFGFGGTGKKSFARQFDTYGEPYGLGDVIGCYIDLDRMEVKWSRNGQDYGKAYTFPHHLRTGTFYAAVCLKNAEIRFNFGATPFKHSPQGGYLGLCNAPGDKTTQSPRAGGGAVAAPKPAARNAPYAIIIEPSRELAEQTFDQITKFKKHLDSCVPREVLIIGGVGVGEQVSKLNAGVDIIVATPGRLEDFINSGKVDLTNVRFFVLDEADGLLSSGYGELINRLHVQMPKTQFDLVHDVIVAKLLLSSGALRVEFHEITDDSVAKIRRKLLLFTSDGKRLQMIVCSATLHSFDVKKMAEKLMYFPVWIDLKGQDSVPETVHHVVLSVDPAKDTQWKNLQLHVETDGVHKKDRINPNILTPEMQSEAIKILKGEYTVRAIREHKMERALIFCRTKLDCDNMEKYLNKTGGGRNRNTQFSCVCLHADRKPPERKANLEMFKRGEVKFLICTDVAARGIDVRGLPYVINVTLPDEKQNYVHRIGRVGRAERMGLAISFVAATKEKVWYHSNCNNRGRGCYNTNLTRDGGCCIWYNEPQFLGDIEEHLGITIDQVDLELKVPTNEFDGKVVYGQKQKNAGSGYKGHVEFLAPTVKNLQSLEKQAQSSYITLLYRKPFLN